MFVPFSRNTKEETKWVKSDQVITFKFNCFYHKSFNFDVIIHFYTVALVVDASVQVELDEELTLRALGDLEKQGTAESYFVNASSQKALVEGQSSGQGQGQAISHLASLNESFQHVAVQDALVSNPDSPSAQKTDS